MTPADDTAAPRRPGDAPSASGFSLRPATEDDVEKIARIEGNAHAAPWTEENVRTELAKPYAHFLVMSDDETDSIIAGYICFWMMFDECQILNVAVDRPYRRLGLARQMVRWAVAEAR